MAVYLDEVEAGCDPLVIGFPHLLLCMGVVLQTGAYLYGFHFDNIPTMAGTTAAQAAAFLNFIQQKGGNVANGVHLYGCCDRAVRYGGMFQRRAWRNEMIVIANALNYHGPVSGFDTSIISPQDGTYVEYRRRQHQPSCSIFYKRNDRMAFVNTGGVIAPLHGNVAKWTMHGGGHWIPMATRKTGAQLGAGAATLHEVNYALRLSNFDVP